MDTTKSGTPEDEREISLNENSLKRPLSVVDVIGGHGPWQFRQWVVFFAASLCNAMLLFSALFLPPQTHCSPENHTSILTERSSSPLGTGNASTYPETRSYVKENMSLFTDISCNSTNCKMNVSNSHPDVSELLYETGCWNSEVEVFAKCSYIVACIVSCLLVFLSTERFGRRPLALVSCLFLTASSLGTSWVNTVAVFLILRFITSLGIFSIYLISAFTLMEYVHKDFKLLYFFTGHLGWGMAHFVLPFVAWLAEDWLTFNIILSLSCMITSIVVWWGPDSPSSYPHGAEPKRTRKSLKYAAFVNGYSTTDVDLLSHNFRLRQENKKHDLGALASARTKMFCFVYSSCLFLMSFTTAFLYFAAKWHPEFFKVDSRRVSFSFLGTTEVASTIVLLFLTCLVPIKYLWACVSVMSSSLLVIIFMRTRKGGSTSSGLLYTLTVFFASAAWTLVLTKSICHKLSNSISKCNLVITALAVFSGALVASAVILSADNQVLLLILAIPHLIFAVATAFLPDYYFGTVS